MIEERCEVLTRFFMDCAYHDQVTVRKYGKKGFRLFVSFFDTTFHINTFLDLMNLLSTPSLKKKKALLSDYAVEGLLGLCSVLIDVLPSVFLVTEYEAYWQVFEKFLGHSASSVRQVFLRIIFLLPSLFEITCMG